MLKKIKKKCGQFFRKMLNKNNLIKYSGDYKTWSEAECKCIGYDSNEIFEKVKDASLKVKKGEAIFERDSFLFYEKSYNYPLVCYVYKIAAENRGKLHLIDVGGSLGSTYYQNIDLLEHINDLQWVIKEQQHFVQYGKTNFEDENLRFCNEIDEIEEVKSYGCVLFSSVLQYIENYVKFVDDIIKYDPPYIIIERTPVGSRDRIWIEKVKEPIYNATYACRMFEENSFIKLFEKKNYTLLDTWKSLVDSDIEIGNDKAEFKSYIFKKELIN